MPSGDQYLASLDAAEIATVVAVIGPSRLTAYRAVAEPGVEALALPELSISQSTRFLEAICGLEVVFRDAVSTAVASRPQTGRRPEIANLVF
ncbi:MAG: hypothetical protein OXF88_15545 [Rhodobacteraceae bacterium]|nr:hypothetical protein [Paracoccaceae bacterium]